MKKTAYLWLILLSFAVVACGGAKSKLVGMWTVESVSGEKAPQGREMTMEFKSDGTFSQSKVANNKNKSKKGKLRTGKWELAKDNKSMKFIYPDNSFDNVEVVKLEAKEFVFKDSENTFTLKKN